MFLFSAGMVTILTFIVTFLQSVTVEYSNKGNFYFGYNLKTNLHDNFWIKKLYEMNIKLFLWIIFIIPGLRIATNYSYEFKILNDISDFLKKNENNLYCIWVCFIIVVCIYCAAVLIEAINFTENKFIKNEAEKCSYNKIMRGDNISDFQLRWLLSLLNDDDVIVAIIFCLAYAERSGKDYMSINTYRIWKDRTRELIYKNVLCKLNNDSYVDELIKKIQKSQVSHFIYPEFVKWLCKSFFVDFDSLMYQQFKDLGDKRIKNNFSLRSYMILRSLLLDEMEVYNSLSFTESENEEIQKELILVRKYI